MENYRLFFRHIGSLKHMTLIYCLMIVAVPVHVAIKEKTFLLIF